MKTNNYQKKNNLKNILSIIIAILSFIFMNSGYIDGIIASENSDILFGVNISNIDTEVN